MSELKVVLRYFPVGDVAGPVAKITVSDLENIAQKHRVSINLAEIKGKDVSYVRGNIREETMNSRVEEVSQSAITITSENETALRQSLKDLIKLYRAPRTVFGAWGSSERGKQILAEICDAGDGWR